MNEFRKYLISIISAAIICAIVNKLSVQAQSSKMLIRLISTVFLVITAFGPLLTIESFDFSAHPIFQEYSADGIIEDVKISVAEETQRYIKDRTQAYIVDRAAEYGAIVTVQVSINDLETMVPDTVTITGNISPYGKNALKKTIATELGIPEENQIWK